MTTNFKDVNFQQITFFHQLKYKNTKICRKIYSSLLRRVKYSHFKCTCFQDFDLEILSVQIVFKSITCLVQKQEKRARAKSGKRGYHSEGKKGRERVQRGICWMIKTKVECMNELVLFSSGLPLLLTDGSKILGLFSWKTSRKNGRCQFSQRHQSFFGIIKIPKWSRFVKFTEQAL